MNDYAYNLGLMFAIGEMFGNQTLNMDDASKFREELHPRDKEGKFIEKGEEGSKLSYTLKQKMKKLQKNKQWEKGKRDVVTREDKQKLVPKFNPKKKVVSEELEAFSKVKPLNISSVKEAKSNQVYRRGSAIKYDDDKKNSEMDRPSYEWSLGGKKLSPEEALKLEKALDALGQKAFYGKNHKNVLIRADFASGKGQTMSARDKNNKSVYGYAESSKYESELNKYQYVVKNIDKYDKALGEIEKDMKEGDRRAYLAYFMHRTRCRIGGSSEMSEGASTLRKEHVKSIDKDGNITLEFMAKNGYWQVEVKDQLLAGFLRHRMNKISDSETLFGVTNNESMEYLREIGNRVGMDDFRNHDFRRFSATIFARDFYNKHKGEYNLEKREERIKLAQEALLYASDLINDLPDATMKYVAPQVLFGDDKELLNQYVEQSAGI